MRLIRRRAPAPDPALLALRSVCHELRPPMAMLTALVRAIEEQSSDVDRDSDVGGASDVGRASDVARAQLARLAVEHAAHAQSVLRQAAEVAYDLPGSPEAPAPLNEVLPPLAVIAPPGRLSVRATPGANRWLVHPQHTRQILVNLVGNAVHYSAGKVQLTARLHGRRLRLGVVDQGAPNPALVTALRRTDPPPGEQGLGLWVVRQLIGQHGGTLRARSLRPAGLLMEVLLPRYRG
jgi:signal transduction histidine kinase